MLVCRTSSLLAGLGLALTLAIACDDTGPQAPGSIRVVVETSGQDVITEGLEVTVAGGPGRPLNTGLEVTIAGLAPGVHTVRLDGVSANCQVSGANPRSVTVSSDETTVVEFTMACTARVGSVRITAATTGVELDPDGYTARVVGGAGQAVAINGNTTIANVSEGAHHVTLEGVASNCAITGADTLAVTVPHGGTANVTFAIQCVGTASVRVTTATTGADIDPNGYTANVIGGGSQAVPVNGSATIVGVSAGQHQVTLDGVAANCEIAGADTVAVTLQTGGTGDVAFAIECVGFGRLEVTVSTTGVNLDPNGYTVDVAAASLSFDESRAVALNSSLTLADLLPAADYRVRLLGVAANCDIAAGGARTVAVTSGATTQVDFDVTCLAPRRLAIVRTGDIYAILSDGTGATPLTTDPAGDQDPAWSSTGRIAFTTDRHSSDAELYVMNEDGTNPVRLTQSAGADDAPSWSPDGQRIVFRSFRNVNSEIYIINADGSGLTRLTNNDAEDVQPAWSSTGKIAFISTRDDPSGELYVMNVDGSNIVRLTNNDSTETSPAWSPDGSMVAFTRVITCGYYHCSRDIVVMNADGSDARRLGTGWSSDRDHADPAWSPNGRVIAFTRQLCDYYYCHTPSVWAADLDGLDLIEITSSGHSPAWKP